MLTAVIEVDIDVTDEHEARILAQRFASIIWEHPSVDVVRCDLRRRGQAILVEGADGEAYVYHLGDEAADEAHYERVSITAPELLDAR